MESVRIAVQLAIGMVFLAAGLGKLRHPLRFAEGVANYEILPSRIAYAAGLALIPLEIYLGTAHLTGWQLSTAIPLALATLSTFAIAVGVNLHRGRALPCYCFGGAEGDVISGPALARLLLLMAGDLLLWRRGFQDGSYGVQLASNPAQLGWALFWAVFVIVASMWLLSISDFWDLVRPCPRCGRPLIKTTTST
jgi:hypothetical protein